MDSEDARDQVPEMEDYEEKLLRISANGEMIDQYKIRDLVENDAYGQLTKVPIHIYIPNPFSKEPGEEYFRLLSMTQELTVPDNITYFQLVSKNQQYQFRLSTSTSTKFKTILSEDDIKYFCPRIKQENYDEIRFKNKCSCEFCKYPDIVCEY